MKSPERTAYENARSRCNNPNVEVYPWYGGRGIEFRFSSFEEFYTEVGPRPPTYVLDRINTNGHYEIGNVQWSTRAASVFNRRTQAAAKGKSSGIPGICYHVRDNKYLVYVNGKYVGVCLTINEALQLQKEKA